MTSPGVDTHNAAFQTGQAALFRAGQNTLVFAEANTSGGPSGGAFYASVTYTPPTAVQPLLSNGWRLANGAYRAHIQGEAGKSYTIQASTNLVQWVDLITTNTPAAGFDFEDKGATNLPCRFYRIKL